eukprot:Tbor_TRINITY_DN5454_c0_g2::TRINITY_DN5454_c0_g2_i1::g.24999::m.24999
MEKNENDSDGSDCTAVSDTTTIGRSFPAQQPLRPPAPYCTSLFRQHALPTFFLTISTKLITILLGISWVTLLLISYYLYQQFSSIIIVDIRYDHINKYQVIPGANGSVNHGLRTFAANSTYPGLENCRVSSSQGSRVVINFTVPSTLKPPISIKYRLVNFFQNYRPYRGSFSFDQQLGNKVDAVSLFPCVPYRSPGENVPDTYRYVDKKINIQNVGQKRYSDIYYNPCGLISWSMFNDTFVLLRLPKHNVTRGGSSGGDKEDDKLSPLYTNPSLKGGVKHFQSEAIISYQTDPYYASYSNSGKSIPLDSRHLIDTDTASSTILLCNSSDFDPFGEPLGTGFSSASNLCRKKNIAWSFDRDRRFVDAPKHKPLIWRAGKYAHGKTDNVFLENGWYDDEPGHSVPETRDEDHLVWSRVAALGDFKKEWRGIDNVELPAKYPTVDGRLEEEAEDVVYQMIIDEFFDVTSFGGEKHFIIEANKNQVSGPLGPIGPNWALLCGYLSMSFISFLLFSFILLRSCWRQRRALAARKTNVTNVKEGPTIDVLKLSAREQALHALGRPVYQTLATAITPGGEVHPHRESISSHASVTVPAPYPFRTVPSLTLDKALEPNSYEAAKYIKLTAMRRHQWRLDAVAAKVYKEMTDPKRE